MGAFAFVRSAIHGLQNACLRVLEGGVERCVIHVSCAIQGLAGDVF